MISYAKTIFLVNVKIPGYPGNATYEKTVESSNSGGNEYFDCFSADSKEFPITLNIKETEIKVDEDDIYNIIIENEDSYDFETDKEIEITMQDIADYFELP